MVFQKPGENFQKTFGHPVISYYAGVDHIHCIVIICLRHFSLNLVGSRLTIYLHKDSVTGEFRSKLVCNQRIDFSRPFVFLPRVIVTFFILSHQKFFVTTLPGETVCDVIGVVQFFLKNDGKCHWVF